MLYKQLATGPLRGSIIRRTVSRYPTNSYFTQLSSAQKNDIVGALFGYSLPSAITFVLSTGTQKYLANSLCIPGPGTPERDVLNSFMGTLASLFGNYANVTVAFNENPALLTVPQSRNAVFFEWVKDIDCDGKATPGYTILGCNYGNGSIALIAPSYNDKIDMLATALHEATHLLSAHTQEGLMLPVSNYQGLCQTDVDPRVQTLFGKALFASAAEQPKMNFLRSNNRPPFQECVPGTATDWPFQLVASTCVSGSSTINAPPDLVDFCNGNLLLANVSVPPTIPASLGFAPRDTIATTSTPTSGPVSTTRTEVVVYQPPVSKSMGELFLNELKKCSFLMMIPPFIDGVAQGLDKQEKYVVSRDNLSFAVTSGVAFIGFTPLEASLPVGLAAARRVVKTKGIQDTLKRILPERLYNGLRTYADPTIVALSVLGAVISDMRNEESKGAAVIVAIALLAFVTALLMNLMGRILGSKVSTAEQRVVVLPVAAVPVEGVHLQDLREGQRVIEGLPVIEEDVIV